MRFFWNTLYYFIYLSDYKFHLIFNKVNPFYWIYKIPIIKKAYAKKGIDLEEIINQAFLDPKHGISKLRSFGFLFLLVFSFCIGIGNIYFVLIHKLPNDNYTFFIFLYGIISAAFNHHLVFKHFKYLDYFKKISKMPKCEKRKWAWISFATIIGVIIFMLYSFYLLIHQKH